MFSPDNNFPLGAWSARSRGRVCGSQLVIINPKPLFPNDKIIATSVGAKEIIKNSKIYENLEPAIKNVDYLIATTSRFRNKNIF